MRAHEILGDPLGDDRFLGMFGCQRSHAGRWCLPRRAQKPASRVERQRGNLGDIEAGRTSPTATRAAAACHGTAGIRC